MEVNFIKLQKKILNLKNLWLFAVAENFQASQYFNNRKKKKHCKKMAKELNDL